MTFEQRQFQDAVKRIKTRYGTAALRMLGPDLRDALIKAEVLAVIAANDASDNPLAKLASFACQYSATAFDD